MKKEKLLLKNVRFSFVRVFTPEASPLDPEPKYSVVCLIPKEDEALVKQIKGAMSKLAKEFLNENPKFKGVLPNGFYNPLRDGDKERSAVAGFEGCYFLTAKRKEDFGAPIVIDRMKRPIENKEQIYSGCWGTVSLALRLYSGAFGHGISVGLNGIQKVRDDERLDGGASLNDFDSYGPEKDDPLNEFEGGADEDDDLPF